MSKVEVPKIIVDGYNSYKGEINNSRILINSSSKILLNNFDKNNLTKISYPHIVAVSTLLRIVIETLSYSSFWIKGKEFQNGIMKEKWTSSKFMNIIEEINSDWIPKSTSMNEINNLSKSELRDYYDFLSAFYNRSENADISTLDWNSDDDIEKVIKTFNLIIERLMNLINNHQVNLFNEKYAYIITIEGDKVSGTIIEI